MVTKRSPSAAIQRLRLRRQVGRLRGSGVEADDLLDLGATDLGAALLEAERRIDAIYDGRPTVRSECVLGPRPCPWFACRYHLGCDEVTRNTVGQGVVVGLNMREERETLPTCALDVADEGGHSLTEIAELMGVDRTLVWQTERTALAKMKRALECAELGDVSWLGE